MTEARPYHLPDYAIFYSERPTDYYLWQPDKTYIVLGRSNRIARESVYLEKAAADGIEVIKRPSGGQAVVLTKNMLVLSVKLPVNNILKTHQYFGIINNTIIESLKKAGIRNIGNRGISDIAIGQKKILGSSVYRKDKTVFYHAVLNISEPVTTISRYLKHPQREPDYRQGRNHLAFVTSLTKEGYNFKMEELRTQIEDSIRDLITSHTF